MSVATASNPTLIYRSNYSSNNINNNVSMLITQQQYPNNNYDSENNDIILSEICLLPGKLVYFRNENIHEFGKIEA